MVQLRVWGRQITHRAADFTQGQKLVGTPTFTYFSAFISIAITILVYQCYQDDLSKSGAWGCEMSWMSPSYQRIQWKDDPGHRYRLFLYREQGLDIESQVTGYPVLFIPGNAGSYQQVRSIASAASRQYADGKTMTGQSRMDRKLDFFTIDFNEEFSAFSARTLSEQANFVRHAIERILLEYLHMSPSQQPSQVALLAHSMGGIAARLAVIDPDVAPKVDIILTMSTPHTIPPLTIEHEMESIYTKIAKPSQTLLISLCGGVSDTQVVSDSCALSSTLGSGDNGFAVYTTGIPTVWTGIDHQAMVWCHQLRWLIAESLIQMAQQDKRMQKLSIARGKFLNDQQTFPSTSRTFKNLSVSSTDMTVLLRPNAATQRISVEALHCDEECQTVSFSVQQLPFPTHSEAPFPLPGEGIRPEETLLALDVKLVNGKGLLSVASDSHEIIAFGPRVTSTTEDSTWAMTPASHIPTSFLVRFGNLASSSLLVRRLEIQTGDCGGFRPIIRYTSSIMSDSGQSAMEDQYYPHVGGDIYLHSHLGAAPFRSGPHDRSGVTVKVYQQEGCPVQHLRLSVYIRGTLAKIVSRYRMTFLAWPIGWTALAMLAQIQRFGKEGIFASLSDGFKILGKRWLLGVCALLLLGNTVQIFVKERFRLESLLLGTNEFALLPVIVFMALWTYGMTCMSWLVLDSTISLTRHTCLRLFPSTSPLSPRVHAQQSLPTQTSSRIAFRAGVPLLLVYLIIPHQLAYVVSLIVLWTLLIWSDHSEMFIEFGKTVSFFMTLLVPFKATSLLVWGRSLWINWKHPLAAEHNLFYAGPALLMVGLYVQGTVIKHRDHATKASSSGLIALAISAFLFGSRWTWTLLPIAHCILLLLAPFIW